jgi:hypothetical protein
MLSRALLRPPQLVGLAATLVAAGVIVVVAPAAGAQVTTLVSSATGSDGTRFTVTNHLTPAAQKVVQAKTSGRHEYLLVWAGDSNAADTTGHDIQNTPLAVNPVRTEHITGVDAPPGPDFLAVIDADKASPTYGKVVNTATVGPLVENEPHHMQYVFHKGDRIFAGGLFSDTTYVFDVDKLPALTLSGVNSPLTRPVGRSPTPSGR